MPNTVVCIHGKFQDSGPTECFRNVGQWTLSFVLAENIWSHDGTQSAAVFGFQSSRKKKKKKKKLREKSKHWVIQNLLGLDDKANLLCPEYCIGQ